MASLLNQLHAEYPLRPGRPRVVGLVLLGLAVLGCLLALAAFPDPGNAPNGWLPYLGSAVLFMAALYFLFPARVNAPQVEEPTFPVVAALGLILAVAIVARTFRLDVLPFGTWNDEAYIGWTAEKILDDPSYRPIYVTDYDHPLHFFALVALSFKILGENTVAIRTVTTVFGMLAVVAAFLAGREIFGNRFGLLMAFLMAVSRWHMTFSRFGIYTITVPFFELLTVWLLLRARRTGQLTDFAWAGMALGFGADFYIGFRLFVAAMGLYWLYWLVTGFWQSRGAAANALQLARLRLIGGFVTFGLAAWFATAPVVEFAWMNPEQYWKRTSDVSIFNHRDQADLGKAIIDNTVKHLLMFNYQGDANGRHNLSGEPMLDPITGMLFVLGITLALVRLRNPVQVLFLLIFIFNLSAGILALDFEAPQSSRAFGAIVAVLYFSALALETLWRSLDRARLAVLARQTLTVVLTCGLGSYMVYYNFFTFFVTQANSDRSWTEYNGVQSLTAKRMLETDPSRTTLYASVFLNNHEAIRFLAPQVTNSRTLLPPIGLPFREPGDRPLAAFVDDSDTWIIDEAKRLYPNATYRVDTTPSGQPILYSVYLTGADIQSVQGANVKYWAGDQPQGQPTLLRSDLQLGADWTTSAPLARPFVARWDTTLYAPHYGQYEFSLASPAIATLWLDGNSVISGNIQGTATLSLAQGDHSLRLQAAGGPGNVRLLWREPGDDGKPIGDPAPIPNSSLYLPDKVPVQGLLGQYFKGSDWQAPEAFARIDPFIDMYIHIIPLPRPYTVDWIGAIILPATGNWGFGLRINGQAEVFVDGRSVVKAAEPGDDIEGNPVNLAAGRHAIRIHYLDYLGGSRIHLYWTPPGGARGVVPSSALSPYLADPQGQ